MELWGGVSRGFGCWGLWRHLPGLLGGCGGWESPEDLGGHGGLEALGPLDASWGVAAGSEGIYHPPAPPDYRRSLARGHPLVSAVEQRLQELRGRLGPPQPRAVPPPAPQPPAPPSNKALSP